MTIPDFVTVYPDFVTEGWTVDNVQKFCDEHGVTLNVKYEETDSYPEGTIISQSRVVGTKVIENTPLNITVAKAKPKEEKPTVDDDKKDEETTEDKDKVDEGKNN